MKMKKRKECWEQYNKKVYDLRNPYEVWIEQNETEINLPKEKSFSVKRIKIDDLAGDFSLNNISEDILIISSAWGELSDNAEDIICEYMSRTGEEYCYADEDYLLTDSTLGDCNDYAVFHQLGLDMEYYDEKATGRMLPWFKPDFSPETLLSFIYVGNIFACRIDSLKKLNLELINSESGMEVYYDLLLKLSEKARFGHISRVLFHNTKMPESSILAGASKEFEEIKKKALFRRKIDAHIEYKDGYCYIVYDLINQPLVSILIPSKDNPTLIRQCIGSIKEKTDYENYEIILIDNGSSAENKAVIGDYCAKENVRYLYQPSEFNFSRMCNTAAKESHGDFLLFLNDDIEIDDSSWLRKMAGELSQDNIGSVGVKLLYPHSAIIQHCGISNAFVGPVHRLQNYSDSYSYYYGRNRVTYNYIGATAACLMVKRDVFESIGGFCEEIKVAYNDVDLCFKIFEAGYRQVVRNDVTIYHHESITRGRDDSGEKRKRLDAERKALYARHPGLDPVNLLKDRFFSIDPYCSNTQLWIRSSLFSPEYIRDYENRFVCSEVECLPDDYPVTPKGIFDRSLVLVSVDSVADTLLYDELTGWAAVTKKDNALFKTTVVLFGEDGKKYGSVPFETIREDVARTITGAENLLLTGIRLRIKKGDIPSGRYHVGATLESMVSKKKYTMLSEYVWEIE